MNLTRFPRRRYSRPTPIQKLERLSRVLDGPAIYIKRDDLLELAGGGNKTRKLEFTVADALAKGCDTLITCGAIQSNHCRLTLAAARQEGMRCHIILEERVPKTYDTFGSGNNLLFHLLGADSITVYPQGINEEEEMEKLAAKVSAEGGKGYILDGSNANGMSALGYVQCAQETLEQLLDMGVFIDHVVTPSGSAGTHGGFLAGLLAMNAGQTQVHGINVRRGREEQLPRIRAVTQEVLALLGAAVAVPDAAVRSDDSYLGPGYAIPGEDTLEAIFMLARLEGILVDPVYTGKAMAGLIGKVRKGEFSKHEKILFLHTGGAPALYAYKDLLLRDAAKARTLCGFATDVA